MNDQEFVDQAMAFINDDCDYLADHERMSKEDERKLAEYERRDKPLREQLAELDYVESTELLSAICHLFTPQGNYEGKNTPIDVFEYDLLAETCQEIRAMSPKQLLQDVALPLLVKIASYQDENA